MSNRWCKLAKRAPAPVQAAPVEDRENNPLDTPHVDLHERRHGGPAFLSGNWVRLVSAQLTPFIALQHDGSLTQGNAFP
jgi:hypothetical protein